MRRFVTLAVLLLFTVPFGVSISGCSKKSPTIFCNGADSGIAVGQVTTITLAPQITGISMNFSQIGQVSSPTATDCKGTAETVQHYTYATFLANGTPDMTIADVEPTNGRLCAGTWNRNTGGGIPDFTTCNPTNKSGTVFVIASGDGASSNPLPIYVHPVVTNVVLGPLSTDCLNDAATNCSPAAFATLQVSCTINPANGCCTAPVTTMAAASASSNGCVSQSVTGQLAARVFAGTGSSQTNVSCQVGHLSYAAQTASVVSIDQNGVATAQQPGSTVITANISNAGSSAGFFSTCPPTSIALSVPGISGSNSNSIIVNPNNLQPITSLVKDMNGTILTGLALEFESTTPTTIPASAAGTVTPAFPGAAAITAVCQPPSCNPSPFNQIGLFGNGKPVTSNPITVIAPGTNSTNLYIASTNSLYLVPVDFTQPQLGAPVRLPYQPNSMVISDDGSTIYMGSAFELMTFSALTNSLTNQDLSVTGPVLAVSPDGTTLVITDPIRQFVYLYSANGTGGIQTQFGGVGTHAAFSPDSQTVYITLGDYDASTGITTPNKQLLVHSQFTGWYQTTAPQAATDVAVGVPYVGAFFGGNPTTARTYCPVSTISGGGQQTTSSTTTNVFYPDADVNGPTTDRVATTNDGFHVLGATITSFTDLVNGPAASPNLVTATGLPIGPCPQIPPGMTSNPPVTFDSNVVFTGTLPGVSATAITGVFPTSDSKTAFVTYTGTGGVLPTYTPATPVPSATPGAASTIGPGTLGSISLSTALGTPTAPITGVMSADNPTFFAATSGDNAVHLITLQADGSYKDTVTPVTSNGQTGPAGPIAPKLPDVNGNIVAPNLLVQKTRKSTN
jgi:trimeric autotransporter adhesin